MVNKWNDLNDKINHFDDLTGNQAFENDNEDAETNDESAEK